MNDTTVIKCRTARKRLRAHGPGSRASNSGMASSEWEAVEDHLQTCQGCAAEFRMLSIELAMLDAAASPEPVTPGDDFFTALRARIARESAAFRPGRPTGDDSWPATLWAAARQLIPAMAVLLLLMLGATVLWGRSQYPPMEATDAAGGGALRPSDRVLFHDVYEYPPPTGDDILEMLVAVEDKKNGK